MNYGFAGNVVSLRAEDEADRFCIQLYERVTGSVDLSNTKVLEVGCGRGGGASYVARYRNPAVMTGIDFSGDAIQFCERRHKGTPNLKFQVGDAERLPFEGGAFDAVINVESSHCYGDIERFFGEVRRVLRPGGRFLFADLREPEEMEKLRQLLLKTGLQVVEEEEITRGVVEAMRRDDERKRTLIESLVPAEMRTVFKEFAGVETGRVFKNLNDGTLVYWRFVFAKNS